LGEELAAWQRRVAAKFPTANPNYAANLPNGRASIRPGSAEAALTKTKQK